LTEIVTKAYGLVFHSQTPQLVLIGLPGAPAIQRVG